MIYAIVLKIVQYFTDFWEGYLADNTYSENIVIKNELNLIYFHHKLYDINNIDKLNDIIELDWNHSV